MSCYWSVAQTHVGQEALAVRNLRRQQFECFYPLLLVERRPLRRLAVKPVFAGYVFVRLDPEVPNWSPINSTLGVRRLLTQLGKGGGDYRKPAAVPFVEELRRLGIHHETGAGGPAEPALPAGTMVRIKRGPFSQHTALVQMSTAERVKLLLQVFSREIEVEFAASAVEVIRRPLGGACVVDMRWQPEALGAP
jgi:transcriptional antiterminator RfaH